VHREWAGRGVPWGINAVLGNPKRRVSHVHREVIVTTPVDLAAATDAELDAGLVRLARYCATTTDDVRREWYAAADAALDERLRQGA